jgi:hypothetical protein
MPSYIGDYGIVYVRTDTTNVLQLPTGWTLVTGISPPAAAPGAKSFAAKGRCRVQGALKALSTRDHRLSSLLLSNPSIKYADLRTGRALMDGALVSKTYALRCQLTTNYPPANVAVHFGELLTAHSALVNCELTRTAAFKYLDGLLTAHSSFPLAELRSVVGKFVDGVLTSTATLINDYPFGELFIAGRIETRTHIRNRATAELFIGDTHFISGTALAHTQASAGLGVHPRAVLTAQTTVQCALKGTRYIQGSMLATSTASMDLQVKRDFQLSAVSVASATAYLNLPLQGILQSRAFLDSVLDVKRYLSGTLSAHSSVTPSLYVSRRFVFSAALSPTASLDLTVPRLFSFQGYAKATASASLESDRLMGALLLCHGSASMMLEPARAFVPPVGEDIFVTPDGTSFFRGKLKRY